MQATFLSLKKRTEEIYSSNYTTHCFRTRFYVIIKKNTVIKTIFSALYYKEIQQIILSIALFTNWFEYSNIRTREWINTTVSLGKESCCLFFSVMQIRYR